MRSLRKTGDTAEDVLAFLEWRGDGVSFAEMLRFMPELKGKQTFGPTDNASVFYWLGLSDAGVAAFARLANERPIVLAPVNPLFYALDGFVTNHPIASGNRRYRKPHWAPVRISRSSKEMLGKPVPAALKPRAS